MSAADSSDSSGGCSGCGCLTNVLFGTPVAMIGYHIHGSVFWAVCDWLFWPLAIMKWLVLHQVNLSIIKSTFAWFLQ